ncbi:MAG: IclR family transcriptional regulator [Rhodobacteraceae bacterium]|nr:IclR family transcriptional regulator [Paracoccaceae bacterium]
MIEKKSYTIEAVARAVSVLEALGENPGQGVTSLAKALGLTKSIVFRLVHTLEESGFVSRDSERAEYSLGYRIGVLGERIGRGGTLMHVAPPVMDRLRDSTGENINLITREGMNSMVLATREGLHSIRLHANSGRVGPLHAGGASLLVLAYSDPAVVDMVLSQPLERFSPNTNTDPEVVRAILSRIRENGYNIALNDIDDGAFSVAAPIINANGRVVAGLSIAGAMVRFDDDRRAKYLTAIRAATLEISDKLSF